LERLAYHMEEIKLDLTERILQCDRTDRTHPTDGTPQDWSAAKELCLQLLQPNPSRRPQSIDDVLTKSRFFRRDDEVQTEVRTTGSQGRADRALKFHQKIASAADAADGGEAAACDVRDMLAAGDTSYTMLMPPVLASVSTAQPVCPLHRAVRTGSLAMVKLFVDNGSAPTESPVASSAEIHPKALAAVLNMRTEFGFTVLHWACFFNHAPIVEFLLDRPLEQQCDASATNYRGKSAWDIADAVGAEAVKTVLERFADLSTDHPHANPALRREKARRKRRPTVDETFRDDIELDMLRFTLWCVKAFDNWTLLAAGAFGAVYLVRKILDIEVSGRRFREAVVKVPFASGVAELKGEVEELGKLKHDNM
jgi:hypothetical protein